MTLICLYCGKEIAGDVRNKECFSCMGWLPVCQNCIDDVVPNCKSCVQDEECIKCT